MTFCAYFDILFNTIATYITVMRKTGKRLGLPTFSARLFFVLFLALMRAFIMLSAFFAHFHWLFCKSHVSHTSDSNR